MEKGWARWKVSQKKMKKEKVKARKKKKLKKGKKKVEKKVGKKMEKENRRRLFCKKFGNAGKERMMKHKRANSHSQIVLKIS